MDSDDSEEWKYMKITNKENCEDRKKEKGKGRESNQPPSRTEVPAEPPVGSPSPSVLRLVPSPSTPEAQPKSPSTTLVVWYRHGSNQTFLRTSSVRLGSDCVVHPR